MTRYTKFELLIWDLFLFLKWKVKIEIHVMNFIMKRNISAKQNFFRFCSHKNVSVTTWIFGPITPNFKFCGKIQSVCTFRKIWFWKLKSNPCLFDDIFWPQLFRIDIRNVNMSRITSLLLWRNFHQKLTYCYITMPSKLNNNL